MPGGFEFESQYKNLKYPRGSLHHQRSKKEMKRVTVDNVRMFDKIVNAKSGIYSNSQLRR